MGMIAQVEIEVKKELYQPNKEILTLADLTLEKANRYRQEWLMTGDARAWQLWRACLADREILLEGADG